MRPAAKIAIGLGVTAGLGGLWWLLARKSSARTAVRNLVAELTPTGVTFLVDNEGVKLEPYPDAGHCSIGVGHLLHAGPCTSADKPMTLAEVRALFAQDVQRFVDGVRKIVTVPLAPHELDALVDFAYTIGLGAFADSTLVKRLNAGDRAAVPSEMLRWVAGNPGAVGRRTREGKVFAEGVYVTRAGKVIA